MFLQRENSKRLKAQTNQFCYHWLWFGVCQYDKCWCCSFKKAEQSVLHTWFWIGMLPHLCTQCLGTPLQISWPHLRCNEELLVDRLDHCNWQVCLPLSYWTCLFTCEKEVMEWQTCNGVVQCREYTESSICELQCEEIAVRAMASCRRRPQQGLYSRQKTPSSFAKSLLLIELDVHPKALLATLSSRASPLTNPAEASNVMSTAAGQRLRRPATDSTHCKTGTII